MSVNDDKGCFRLGCSDTCEVAPAQHAIDTFGGDILRRTAVLKSLGGTLYCMWGKDFFTGWSDSVRGVGEDTPKFLNSLGSHGSCFSVSDLIFFAMLTCDFKVLTLQDLFWPEATLGAGARPGGTGRHLTSSTFVDVFLDRERLLVQLRCCETALANTLEGIPYRSM